MQRSFSPTRLIALVTLFLTLIPWSLFAAPKEAKRLFIVNSYRPDYFWSARQQEGIRQAFEGEQVVVEEFFLRSRINPTPEWLKASAKECIARIEAFKPDLIFTGDDNATRTVGVHYKGSDIPVIFYGLNAEPWDYSLLERNELYSPRANVTGVLERGFYFDSLLVAKELSRANGREINKAYLVTDDSYTSTKLMALLEKIDWRGEAEVVILPQVGEFATYKELVRSLDEEASVLFIINLQTLKDDKGEVLGYQEVIDWTRARLKIPTVGFHLPYIKRGLTMGVLVTGNRQAYYAGLKGRELLAGKPIGEVPVEQTPKGAVTFNYSMLKELGLKIPVSLTMGATIVKRDD